MDRILKECRRLDSSMKILIVNMLMVGMVPFVICRRTVDV